MKLLTLVVPAYNAQAYLDKCVDSLLPGGEQVEIIIVNDGSSDDTAQIADGYATDYPTQVRVIHQDNAGHGGAVNSGIAAATGKYLKVVDSDDWLGAKAYAKVMELLRYFEATGTQVDLVLTNYVYDKVGKRVKHVANYRNALPTDKTFTFEEMGRFRSHEYVLMHAMMYRTELLHEVGLKLPEHTFYVDFLFAYVPLPAVRTLYYLDVNLYHYFIGRDDQSVNEKNMIKRLDQLFRVNSLMIESYPDQDQVPEQLARYMAHFLKIETVICSLMSVRSADPVFIAEKDAMWQRIEAKLPRVYQRMSKDPIVRLFRLPGSAGDKAPVAAYRIARKLVGFN